MLSKTLLKTFSYAFMHMVIAIMVAYALSGSWKVALAIGLTEPCIQTIAFFFHERAWHNVEERNESSPRVAPKDHHDSVIDSVSPVSRFIDKILWHKH